MVRFLLLALAFLVFPNITSAQLPQYRGVSAFAAMHPSYPCDALLATTDFSPRPAISVLYDTFGFDDTCIRRFVARNHWRPHLVQIHFSNEVCRRNRNCIDEILGKDFVSEYNKRLENLDKELVQQISVMMFYLRGSIDSWKNENTRVIIGAGLEDNYSSKAFENLVSIMRGAWPWEISRNRHQGGNSLNGANLQEFHSASGKPGSIPCIANEDGNYDQSRKDSQKFLKRYAKCSAVFLWREEHQGRSEGGKRIPPKERTFTYTAKDVVELGGLIQ